MTAVAEETTTDAPGHHRPGLPGDRPGRRHRVPGRQMPAMFNALHVEVTGAGDAHMTLEVALHLGDDIVRSIAMKPTDGMQRGAG